MVIDDRFKGTVEIRYHCMPYFIPIDDILYVNQQIYGEYLEEYYT